MELFIIIVLLAVATETTFLSVSAFRKDRRTLLSPVFVDTSVLIDGRIMAIAESGFITRPLYIPRSVVGELQFLADNADSDKRTRARHGLDVINQLQSLTTVETRIFSDGVRAEEGVDNRLLKLAKKYHGALCTIDYNLNKVAVVEGIQVLNVNDLAKTLRMAYLPGEKTRIELTQKGNDQHQAIGHLEDGTMVVVEHAFKQIGTIVEVEFIRSLQTAAGKMMFARLTQQPHTKLPKQSSQSKQRVQKPTGRTPQKQPSSDSDAQLVTQKSLKTTSKDQQSAKQSMKSKGRSSRNRSPEDSLVELANR